MENKALKQRLENLAQEQLIKYFVDYFDKVDYAAGLVSPNLT
uniref:Uncharacterized protein n=1 Tax=Solanum lycopersicum TaxID=4081 RepID=A0A494G9N0_SOLLC